MGHKGKLLALHPGYKNESKKISYWNTKSWKKSYVDCLCETLIEQHNGKHFKVAIATHSSVFKTVFGDAARGLSIPSIDYQTMKADSGLETDNYDPENDLQTFSWDLATKKPTWLSIESLDEYQAALRASRS